MTTMSAGRASAEELAELLKDVRARTLTLIGPISDDDLLSQHSPLMSPIVWDLGHIASFEELWLLRHLVRPAGTSPDAPTLRGEMPGVYNPFENPRPTRGELSLPARAEVLEWMAQIRHRVLDTIKMLDDRSDEPLDRYLVRMVAQHEAQHNETMLQTLQLKKGDPYRAPRATEHPAPPERSGGEAVVADMVRFPGGEVEIGTDDRTAAYDNERPLHRVTLEPFWIDRAPVSNRDYLEFMDAGGYATRAYWSEAGWAWRDETGAEAPMYWERVNGEWQVRVLDRTSSVPEDHPVCHVCCHEAEAFARWAGKRLPSELEWEAAATWEEGRGKRAFPWGDEAPTRDHANLDQLAFGTSPIGAYPLNVSPIGCVGMIGDVWEWTASDFAPYPGFEMYPYREYSEVFFTGEYKVLRGGSWATRPLAIRGTFRNWDYPIRRQLFSGFRCARHG